MTYILYTYSYNYLFPRLGCYSKLIDTSRLIRFKNSRVLGLHDLSHVIIYSIKLYYERLLFFIVLIVFVFAPCCAAPCQPSGLNATLSCTDNVARVNWMSSMGGQLYIVNAVSMNGTFIDTCSGFDGSCDLSSLGCGLQYTATVVAQHSVCRSLPSPPTSIRTGRLSPGKLACHQTHVMSLFKKKTK